MGVKRINEHDIVGSEIRGLKIISLTDPYIKPNGGWEYRYNVLCICGKEFATTRHRILRAGIKSCGCLNTGAKSHGGYRESLYLVWGMMIQRCSNPNLKKYNRYGRRGIVVCKEWRSYELFREWSHANGYKKGLTLDRIDNNGNYEPGNCRWTTYKVQMNNFSANRHIAYKGKTQTLQQWCDELGFKYHFIYHRIVIAGWSVEDAFERGQTEKNIKIKENSLKPNSHEPPCIIP